MRNHATHALTVLACCLGCLLAAPAPAQDQTRAILGSQRLRVLYWPQDRELAQLGRTEGEAALRRLEVLLGVKLQDRVDVYIVRSKDEFDELTGAHNSPWVLGMAIMPGRVPGGARESYRVVVMPMGKQRLPVLLTHELAHVMLDARMGDAAGGIPRWLHEGIAKYAAREFGEGDKQAIAQASLENRLLALDQLDPAFGGDQQQVALAYAESYTLVAYLSDLVPAKGVGPLLEQLQRGRDIRLALGLAYGKPVPEMEQEWLAGIRGGYLTTIQPPWSEVAVGVAFVVSFLLAWAVVRRRSAAIRRRMQDQQPFERPMGGVAEPDEADGRHEAGNELED